MLDILVRTATLEDLDILMEFELGILGAERPFDPTLKDGELRTHDLTALVTASNSEVVIGVVDEQPIGCGYAQIRDALDYLKHLQYAHVGLIYVKPEFRGNGVTRAMIGVLGEWILSMGVHEMRLEVYHDNVKARRAYEKAGFAPHMLSMRMDLRDDSL
ncbi:MAG: GNAT family N-acetyltransferase [Chryseolinea sp.]